MSPDSESLSTSRASSRTVCARACVMARLYLKRLEGAGFLRREIDASDLRRYRLSVTPAGRNVVTRGFALLSEAFGERLSRLSAAEQTQLNQLLEKLS